MAPNGNGAARTARVVDPTMAVPAIGRSAPNSRIVNTATALNMKLEVDRLTTFSKWPVSFINKSSMASAGFYYFNEADVVRCAFCGVEVGRWEEGDNPIEEHKRWAPSCPFLRRNVGNETNSNSAPSGIRKPVYDECGLYGVEIRPNSGPENGKHCEKHLLEQLGIHKNRGISHIGYVSMNARMKSFDSWPKYLTPRPEELAEAGFFYTGKGDQTVCFNCGVALKNWQPNDEPWIEHCKWFPECTYVVMNKGKSFIQKTLSEKQPKAPSKDIQNLTIHEEEADKKSANACSKTSHEPVEATPHEPSNDSSLCKICFKEELGVVFLPCGHLVACVKCAPAVTNCPICRKPLTATVRVFLS